MWPDDTDEPPAPGIITPISPLASSTTSPPSALSPLPEWKAIRRCLDLFVKHHWATDFCCSVYRPDFEARYAEIPFLTVSIISLCARYLTQDEARSLFGCETPHQVWATFTPLARSLAKETLDEPSGMCLPPYPIW